MNTEDYKKHYSIVVDKVIKILPIKSYSKIYIAIENYRKENNFDKAFFNVVMGMARLDYLKGVFDIEELDVIE